MFLFQNIKLILQRWLYTPRGCAVFYVPKRNQHLIRTSLPTSHGYQHLNEPPDPNGKTPFVHLFEFVATIDYTPYCCIPAALEFRRKACGGEVEIRNYCFEIAKKGGQRVAELLGTTVMDNSTQSMSQCCFTNVALPLQFVPSGSLKTPKEIDASDAGKVAKWLHLTAVKEHDTYLQIAFHAGILWVRLSGQIYLELKDFEWIGHKLRDLCERVEQEHAT